MARILWLNWSGGGNLPPSLGIARGLAARGHDITFAGRPEMLPRVVAAGFRGIELSRAYEQVARYPAHPFLTRMSCYLTSPAIEEQVRAVVAAQAPDLVLVDAMFPAALAQVPGFPCPTALMLHTFIYRQLDMWQRMLATLDGMRTQAGFPSLPSQEELWHCPGRIVVTSFAELDAPPAPGWDHVRHVGPVLEDEAVAVPAMLPWAAEDATPLVLVSFSTGFEQRNVGKLQRSLDALAALPVHVVATTGGIVEPHELTVPDNAIVLRYAAHDPILARAALTVTHGGHGTAMRALRAAVPMVVIPGVAGDQPYVAAAVQEWRAGIAVPAAADQAAIREAAAAILADPAYRRRARFLSKTFAGRDSIAEAVREILDVMDGDWRPRAAMGAGPGRGAAPPRALRA